MNNPEEIAKKLTEKIANSAFKLFQEKELRKMINFEELEQIEQDRIFNEIVVSGLVLAVLMYRTIADMSENEKRSYFFELQMEMTSTYSAWLGEMGTPREFTEMWKELIKMRCKEYEKDFKKHKKDLPDPESGNPWVPVLAYGSYVHIRRGKTDEKDPLFLYLNNWINNTATEISKAVL